MPSQVAARPIRAAQIMARPGLLVSRSPVAAGPMSSAVLRIVPMVMADKDTAIAIAIRHSSPTSRTGIPRDDAEAQHAQQRYGRDYRTADGEYGSEQDRDRRARRIAVGGVPVEEQCRQAEARSPHDAGCQVPSPGPPDPDHVHDPRRRHPDTHQTPQRGDSDEEGCRPAGDAEVRERMAGV